jgi:hypothetical protein
VRLGILSDLHCELEPAGSRWINPFASERLDAMADEALAWFRDGEVDLIVVLGDLVQFPQPRDLEHILARLAAGAHAPLAVVNGNHDLRLGGEFAARARSHGISLLSEQPLVHGGVAIRGVEVERGAKPPQYRGRAEAWTGEAAVGVLASHFPLLSQAERVAAAGLPYAGDLVNRGELEARIAAEPLPTLVLSGHIHARCTHPAASLLQFTVGALIEPPFDATIVEVDAEGPRVRRTARRLGEIAAIDPVFAPDEEEWEWDGRWLEVDAA